MRFLLATFLFATGSVFAQSDDVRRVDMFAHGSKTGFSLEQIKRKAVDPDCNCESQSVTTVLSKIDPAFTISPYSIGTSSIRHSNGFSFSASTTFEINAVPTATRSLILASGIQDRIKMANERERVVSAMARDADQRLKQSQDFGQALASHIRGQTSSNQHDFDRSFAAQTAFSAGALARSIALGAFDPATSREMAPAAGVEKNPFTYKKYRSSEAALKVMENDLAQMLGRKNFRSAIRVFESLHSDVSQTNYSHPAFNGSGIIVPERTNPNIPTSPLSNFQITSTNDQSRQLIQRSANEFQAIWGETQGLQNYPTDRSFYFFSGLAAVRSADEVIDQDEDEGLALLAYSRVMLDFAVGVGVGAAEEVISTAKILPSHVVGLLLNVMAVRANPGLAFEKAKEAIFAFPDAAHAIMVHFNEQIETIKSGSAYDRGVLAGHLVTKYLIDRATGAVGKRMSFPSTTGRLPDHVLRMDDKIVDGIIKRTDKLPAGIKQTLKDKSIPFDNKTKGLAFYEQLAESTNPEVQKLAEKIGKKSIREPKVFGLDKERVNRHQTIHRVYDAKDVNQAFKLEKGFKAPNAGSSVIEFSSKKSFDCYRVGGPGSWCFRKDVIENLSREEFVEHAKKRFGLAWTTDTKLYKGRVQAGSKVLRSMAAEQRGLPGGGVQYYLLDGPTGVNFTEVPLDFFKGKTK